MIDEASSRSRAASTALSCHILIREKSHPAIRLATFCVEASPPIHWWVGDFPYPSPCSPVLANGSHPLDQASILPVADQTAGHSWKMVLEDEWILLRQDLQVFPVSDRTTAHLRRLQASWIVSPNAHRKSVMIGIKYIPTATNAQSAESVPYKYADNINGKSNTTNTIAPRQICPAVCSMLTIAAPGNRCRSCS